MAVWPRQRHSNRPDEPLSITGRSDQHGPRSGPPDTARHKRRRSPRRARRPSAGLNEAIPALAECEPWRLPDEDLAALVQVSEVAHRRLLMVQVAAAEEAGKRGLPGRAGFRAGPRRARGHGRAGCVGAVAGQRVPGWGAASGRGRGRVVHRPGRRRPGRDPRRRTLGAGDLAARGRDRRRRGDAVPAANSSLSTFLC